MFARDGFAYGGSNDGQGTVRGVKKTIVQAAPVRGQPMLRIMATTDLHAQILPYDYYADSAAAPAGLAVLGALVRHLRGGAAASVLLDNGDFLQGNPMADWAATAGRHLPHPVAAAMNALGYDAGTLGNHEFNYGLEFLDKVLGELRFPVVSANVGRSAGPVLAPPWLMIDRQVADEAGALWPLRIGVIGFAPPQIRLWERLQLGDRIATSDIVAAARLHVPAMRAAGADVVVALCHSGIGGADHSPGMENAALPLAAVAGIDALVVGHTHGVFPAAESPGGPAADPAADTLAGKPAVMAGALGSHLGVIDLHLTRAGGGWQVTGHAVSAVPATALGESPPLDPAVAAAAADAHGLMLTHIRQPIGATARPVNSHFALIRADDSLQLMADAQAAHARRVLRGTAWAGLPLLSAVAPFRAGGRGGPQGYIDIPAGPLSIRHAAELYIYPNQICVIETTGAVLAEWVERAAGLFLTLRRGIADQPLIDPAFPSYNFDVLFGLTWEIDPSAPPGARVRDLRHAGAPLAPGGRFAVVTNSYRAGGGGGFDHLLAGAEIIHARGESVRDILVDHLRHARPRAAVPVWRFAPLPGTAAWFGTAPRAQAADAPDRDLDDLGTDAAGFRRFRLRFGAVAPRAAGRQRRPARA